MVLSLLAVTLLTTTSVTTASPSYPLFSDMKGASYNVSYDKRALMLNGEHALFISGAVHPPRGSPNDWENWITLARENNLNMLQVYIFWNFHEEEEGVYNWQGRGNLSLFMEKAAAAGLFVNLRIGPYVCAEWTYGGLPAWLGLKAGVKFRETNSVWQPAMEKWFNVVIDRMAAGKFFANQGGPIVLVQVENELPHTDTGYVEWCGTMAHAALDKVNVDVPITMCNGATASSTINTCNGQDCSSYLEQHGQNGKVLLSQPGLWTENEGGFQTWGGAPPPGKEPYFWGRSIGDQSLSVMKWFARGGSHMNYYMWVGGNQFGRWTGDAITTMYAVDAMVCPDGLPHEPKFTQMTAMHNAIAAVSDRIVGDVDQLNKAKKLSGDAVAYIYGGETEGVAFIECLQPAAATPEYPFIGCGDGHPVTINGHSWTLPIEPSSTLVDLKTGATLFSTQVPVKKSQSQTSATIEIETETTTTVRQIAPVANPPFHTAGWQEWREPVLSKDVPPNTYAGNASFSQTSPLEQTLFTMSLAPDAADMGARSKRSTYAFYETTIDTSTSKPVKLSVGTVQAMTLFAFVDGTIVAHAEDLAHSHGTAITLDLDLTAAVENGNPTTTITILSEEMGYANYGFKGMLVKGISGNVTLDAHDITSNGWNMRGGLAGEHLALFTAAGAAKVTWTPATREGAGATWYKTSFTTPPAVASGASKLLINATGLNRGRFWVNGHDVGRYYLDQRNDDVQCLSSFVGPPVKNSSSKCAYNTSAPYGGSQCLGLHSLPAADASAAACSVACCEEKSPTWQWTNKKDAKGDVPGCWCGTCDSAGFFPNPAWVGGHDDSQTRSCATQTLYYVPKDWLLAAGNDLVLFEGGGLQNVGGNIDDVGLTLATMVAAAAVEDDMAAVGNRLDGIHSCAF